MSGKITKTLIKREKEKSEKKKNKGLFAETHTVAPAPSRDYYALHLYQKKFLWTRWKISHRPSSVPAQKVVFLHEFSKDLTLQNELTYIFGEDTTNLIKDIAEEKWSLTTMPSSVLQKILSYISVPDILMLSQVCKRLSKECSKNELWRAICKKQWKILIHNDIEKANLIGWKKVFLEKMRPRRHQVPLANIQKSSILQRNKILTASPSTLNTPVSESSIKFHKKVQELKKNDAFQSSSAKDFKTTSISTGKSTDRTFKLKPFSRNSEFTISTQSKLSPKPQIIGRKDLEHRSKFLNQSSQSVVNLMPVLETKKVASDTNKKIVKSPRKTTKCKVTSIRPKSVTSQPGKPTETSNSKSNLTRPISGKIVKSKQ